MTMTTATTTPQINDLIGWLKENHGNRAVRASRFSVQFFGAVCQTTT